MITMSVLGFARDATTDSLVLVLGQDNGTAVLPIWIGHAEALSISAALQEEALPRPLAHDLVLQAVHELGGTVSALAITSLEEGTFYAVLDVLTAGKLVQLDCRPSDGVAVALRANVPIMVDDTVLAAAAVQRRKNERPGDVLELLIPQEPPQLAPTTDAQGETEENRLSELLQSLDPVSKRVM